MRRCNLRGSHRRRGSWRSRATTTACGKGRQNNNACRNLIHSYILASIRFCFGDQNKKLHPTLPKCGVIQQVGFHLGSYITRLKIQILLEAVTPQEIPRTSETEPMRIPSTFIDNIESTYLRIQRASWGLNRSMYER